MRHEILTMTYCGGEILGDHVGKVREKIGLVVT